MSYRNLSDVGHRMLVVSIERPISPHSTEQPTLSLMEVQDLGNPLVMDDLGFITSAHRVVSQEYQTTLLAAALNGETLSFATPNAERKLDRAPSAATTKDAAMLCVPSALSANSTLCGSRLSFPVARTASSMT